jgi:hypothetical protein
MELDATTYRLIRAQLDIERDALTAYKNAQTVLDLAHREKRETEYIGAHSVNLDIAISKAEARVNALTSALLQRQSTAKDG